MSDLETYYRTHLRDELKCRQEKNRRYSLRAFAGFLKVDNGFLSRLLKGKCLLSLDVADAMTKRLKLSSDERTQFLRSVAEEQQCHALYLLDPTLTACDESLDEINRTPAPRKKAR